MPGYSLDVEQMKDSALNNSHQVEPQATSTPTPQSGISGWNLPAQAIDRILFVIYLIIICIYFLAYIGGVVQS